MLEGRIRNGALKNKIMTAEEASKLIENGMNVGTSGFTLSGYPKAVPKALAKRVRETGEEIKICLLTGASVGDELDGELARAGIIAKRFPYQTNNCLRDSINGGSCEFLDMHLGSSAQYVRYGFLGDIDVAIVEAVAITEDGHIIPTTSVGNAAVYVEMAKKVIVEINSSQPMDLWGMSDIYTPTNPPNRKPIPLIAVSDRIGTPFIPCGIDKIAAVVISDLQDETKPFAAPDEVSERISRNIIEFFECEIKQGRLTENLLPLQSGVGNVANAVLKGLMDSRFENLTCYTEVIQDSMLDLIESGKVKFASSTALSLSPNGVKRFLENIKFFSDKILLRPQEISNSPEVIRRLGVIAMNTAVEFDMYGNVNSTLVMGQKLMNGIGGSADFARNAYISIFSTPSVAKGDLISCVVPMVSHHDHVDQDVMVVATEYGVADLRGKSPKERACLIINNCAHPHYKPMLQDYFERAQSGGFKHTPHLLEEALSWHQRFLDTGSMKSKV